MDKIGKIRRKIKELQDEFISIHPKDCSLELIKSYAGYVYLDKVLSFLETLEKEEKSSEGLEEEIERWFNRLDNKYCRNMEEYYGNDIEDTARHFAQWGAEHLKK